MKKLLISLIFLVTVFNTVNATVYYVAPASLGGLDTNPGTILLPFQTLAKGVSVLGAGDILNIRGGIYYSTAGNAAAAHFRIEGKTGTSGQHITIQSYPGEVAIFDCYNIVPTVDNPYAMYFNGNTYVDVKGKMVLRNLRQVATGAGISRGWIFNNSNNCTLEFIDIYNMGGTGLSLSTSNNNLIKNCDFHHNGDGLSVQAGNVPDPWNATDGWSDTGGDVSNGNVFDGCRMYLNSDDGCDFFDWNGTSVTIKNCWSFWNSIKPWGPNNTSLDTTAMTPANPSLFFGTSPSQITWQVGGVGSTPGHSGEGFKAGGGSQTGHNAILTKKYWNCLAVQNVGSGFPGNATAPFSGQYQYWNCAAYQNGKDGFQYASGWATGIAHHFRNCWAWDNYKLSTFGTDVDWSYDGLSTNISNNVWMSTYNGINYGNLSPGRQVSSSDFNGLNTAELANARKSDGSLPDISFLHLASNSDLIDAGINVGNAFSGSAPDVNVFEFVPPPNVFYMAPPTASPAGNDANPGTIAAPVRTLGKLISLMSAGDIGYLRGGTYQSTAASGASVDPYFLISGLTGTSTAKWQIWGYPGERPVFDLTSVGTPGKTDCDALLVLNCSYLHLKNIRFTGLKQNRSASPGLSIGIEVNNCPNCIFENIESDHMGGSGWKIINSNDLYVLNCDAHHNDDRYSVNSQPWGGADGFDITQAGNTTNRVIYENCRAWLNSDDGWDNFATDGKRTWINCWSFWNGYYQDAGMPTKAVAGNGEGFKLGPFETDKTGIDTLRILKNCWAFDNGDNGFDQNGTPTSIYKLYNCTSYKNQGHGFQFQYFPVTNNLAHTLKNNAALSNGLNPLNFSGLNTNNDHNTWNGGVTFNNADFLNLGDSLGITGARASDGSLPVLNFLRLSQNSDLVDAGVNVGNPFNGVAPDMGAYETSPSRYYVSFSTGNDANLGTKNAPWKTMAKVASGTNYAPGDSVLLMRGDTWNESLIIPASGSASKQFVIGAYGAGAKPILSGFNTASGWTSVGTNLYQSAVTSALSTCNILSINGINYAKGRTPDVGYWNQASTNGSTTITDATHLNAATLNWTGANVIIREAINQLNTHTITSASTGTITFNAAGTIPGNGWGYFIQNDQRACNLQNEWAYNSTTKKVIIYSSATPTNIKVPAIETGIDMNGKQYVSVDNLDIRGFNTSGVYIKTDVTPNGIAVQNSDFSFIGVNAIDGNGDGTINPHGNVPGLKVINNTFTDIGSRGIWAASSTSAQISNNILTRIGNFPGMGSDGDNSYTGIISDGNFGQINNNTLSSIGYNGIHWDGSSTLVQGNYINTTTYVKDGGGSIYSFPMVCSPVNGSSTCLQTTRTVRDNIVMNSPGASAGSPMGNQGCGIYMDGQSPNIRVINNTAANDLAVTTGFVGIFVNGGNDVFCDSNTTYNWQSGYSVAKINAPINNITVTNNIFVAVTPDVTCGLGQYSAQYLPGIAGMPVSFTANNNVYARPLNETQGWIYKNFGTNCNTLAQWKTASGQDAGSTSSPKLISTVAEFRFDINPTGNATSVTLPFTYRDMRNVTYTGSASVPAYGSKLYVQDGLVPPSSIRRSFYLRRRVGG